MKKLPLARLEEFDQFPFTAADRTGGRAVMVVRQVPVERVAWQRRGRIVINTGSCVLPLGGTAVDFTDNALVVRCLEFRRGEVRAGPVRHRVDLDALRLMPAATVTVAA